MLRGNKGVNFGPISSVERGFSVILRPPPPATSLPTQTPAQKATQRTRVRQMATQRQARTETQTEKATPTQKAKRKATATQKAMPKARTCSPGPARPGQASAPDAR